MWDASIPSSTVSFQREGHLSLMWYALATLNLMLKKVFSSIMTIFRKRKWLMKDWLVQPLIRRRRKSWQHLKLNSGRRGKRLLQFQNQLTQAWCLKASTYQQDPVFNKLLLKRWISSAEIAESSQFRTLTLKTQTRLWVSSQLQPRIKSERRSLHWSLKKHWVPLRLDSR